MERIATFHTHFGALNFHRRLQRMGAESAMMPVPRKLSASCGTCVRFAVPFDADTMADEDLDKVYDRTPEGYQLIFANEE